MYFVYVLKSLKNGQFYVGLSKDPYRRLKEHNAGMQKSTKGYIPYQLIYSKKFPDRKQARKYEKYLKSGCGREYIKNLFPCSSAGRASGC